MRQDSTKHQLPELGDLLLRVGLNPKDLPSAGSGKRAAGAQGYAEALYLLTRMQVEPQEAKGFWADILRHHQAMNQALGRDVGVRVAVCDYFMNMHPRMRNPVIVEVQVLLQKEQGALVDELTGLFNRRSFNDALGREVDRFKRFGHRFSLVMLDVDHFKKFNDTYGHLAGDEALKSVAQALRCAARSFDHVTRFGGEEFALVLPHTGADQAIAAAERMRAAIAASQVPLPDGGSAPLTVSLGVATFPGDALNARDLLKRADEALYEAKRTRNCACSASERKRRHPRAPLHMPVVFSHLEGEVLGAPLRITSRNVSFGGMLCVSPAPLRSGARGEIALEPQASGGKVLRMPARVARVERVDQDGGYGVALAFDMGSMEERRALVSLVGLDQDRLLGPTCRAESAWPGARAGVSLMGNAG